MLFYAVWMGDQVVLRYNTFIATAFDLGNMDQAIWNTLHGRPFQFTNHGSNWYGYPIRLAQHVEPIIFLLSLLYAFHADPRILLIFQTLALSLWCPACLPAHTQICARLAFAGSLDGSCLPVLTCINW